MTALIVLSALGTGFAHRMSAGDPEPDLSAFVLPDGSIPFLCKASPDGSHPSGDGDDCPACRLVDASVMPPP
jgi:hypothetical protein